MKASEIRNLSVQELNEKLSDLKSELFNLRFQHAINQLENPMRLGASGRKSSLSASNFERRTTECLREI